MSENEHQCSFIGETGAQCTGLVKVEDTLCFWHDVNAPRDMPDLKQRLEGWIAAGHSLEGASLHYANLEGFAPQAPDTPHTLNAQGADFYHANLRGARLVCIDFKGATFWKADLLGANLSGSDLQEANLLYANIRMARIDRVIWGPMLLQERLGLELQARHPEEAKEAFAQAEEISRDILAVCTMTRLEHEASFFFQKQQKMRLKQMRRFSKPWILSKLVELSCGYGEQPARVIGMSTLIIAGFSLIYLLAAVEGPGGIIEYKPGIKMDDVFSQFLTMLYFSIVTFTTLGYGDIYPVGWVRFMASMEAFIGAFMMALFVVVFVKKLLR